MNERKLKTGLLVAIAALGTIVFSLFLLRSFNPAVALFVMAFVGALLLMEPFAGLVVFLLVVYMHPTELVPALSGANLKLAIFLALGGMASLLLRTSFENKRIRLLHGPLDPLIWWFLVAIVLSHLSHMDIGGGVSAVRDVARLFVLYILISNLVSSEHRLNVFMGVLGLCTLFLAIEGMFEHFVGVGFYGQTAAKGGRIANPWRDPNILGMLLVMGLPFVYLSNFGRHRFLTIVYRIVGSAAIVYAMYLTNSRGTMIGLAAVVTAFLITRIGWRKGIFVSVIIFALIYVFGPSRMSTISASDPRVTLWKNGLTIFASNPLFGIGYGEWGNFRMIAHNSFIHCAAQLGLFGLLPWVTLIYLSVRYTHFFTSAADTTASRTLKTGGERLFLSLIGFVFTGMFLSKPYEMLLFIVIGATAALLNVFIKRNKHNLVWIEKRDYWHGLLITLGGLVVFTLFVLIANA